MSLSSKFSKNFKFATATAAYQIEGGTDLDGRGRSTWDEIREQPGRIADGSDPKLSCDGRIKYKEDVKLLKEIGVTSYRFSISWSRILPDGDKSSVSEEGIAFYQDLCQLLVQAGIEPIVTLFHADLPMKFFDNGSWLNEENCDHFINFSELCFEKFGEWVKTWITFNEINMQAWCGMAKFEGEPWHCPDRPEPKNKEQVPYIAATNMLIAHAKIYRVYESKYKTLQNGQVGIVNGGRICFPATDNPEDVKACDRALDWLFNYTIEPIFGKTGDYPTSMRQKLASSLPKMSTEHAELIKGSADFIGINYYVAKKVRSLRRDEKANTQMERDAEFVFEEDDYERICGNDWVRYAPNGLHKLLNYIKLKYNNIPVFITENGCMDLALPNSNDKEVALKDSHRVKYIKGHLKAVSKALADGCNIIGYTVWSLMDNFEWDDGFSVRFGICRVDFSDPKKTRTMKDSAKYYQSFISEFEKMH